MSSSIRDADPTQAAPIVRRPLSSTFIAVLKPCPSRPPIRFSAGTRQFSKITSAVCAPRCPIFRSGLPTVMPGEPASTMKAETPPAPFCAASVRAISVKMPASGAFVM